MFAICGVRSARTPVGSGSPKNYVAGGVEQVSAACVCIVVARQESRMNCHFLRFASDDDEQRISEDDFR